MGDPVNGFSVGDSVLAPLNPSFIYGLLSDACGGGGLKDGMRREYIAVPAYAMIKLPKLPKSSNSFDQWAAVVQAGSTV